MSRLFCGAVVAVLVLLLTACGDDEGFTNQNVVIPAGYLRVVNAIPDSPQLNILVRDSLLQRVSFGLSSPFLEVLPDVTLNVTVNYVKEGQIVDVFKDEPLIIGINSEATLVLSGTMASPNLVRFENPPTSEVTTTQLELQFAHVATSQPDPVRIQLSSGTSVVQDITLAYGATTELFATEEGDYTLSVRDAGTNTEFWNSGNFSLTAGARGFVPLIDYFGPGPASARLITVGDDAARLFANEVLPSELRVANMTPDRGPLDFYVDDTLLVSNVPFGTVTPYMDVPNGEATLTIRPFGDPVTVLSENTDMVFARGAFHTVTATGLTPDSVSQLYVDNTRRVAVRSILSATNAAPSISPFDLYLLEPGDTVVDNFPRAANLTQIPSAGSSQVLTLDEGSYDLVVTVFSDTTVLLGPIPITLVPGGLYSLYVTDMAGGGEPVEVVLSDDF